MSQAVATRGRYRPPSPEQVTAVAEAMTRGLTLAAACAEVGVNYTTIRSRIERDEALAEAIEAAKAKFHSRVIAEITRRAIDGVEKTIFHDGEPCGTETKYSDRLLLRLADLIPGLNPTKRVEHVGEVTHRVEVTQQAISPDVLRALTPEQQIALRKAIVEDAFRRAAIDAEQRLEALSNIIMDAQELGAPQSFDELAALPSPQIIDADYEPVTDDIAEQLRELEELL